MTRMGVTIGMRHYASIERIPTESDSPPWVFCRDCVDAGCSLSGNARADGGCRAGRKGEVA